MKFGHIMQSDDIYSILKKKTVSGKSELRGFDVKPSITFTLNYPPSTKECVEYACYE